MRPVTALPILVVDDEPPLLRSVSAALRAAGFPEVVTLDDARRVMPVLREESFGAMLLDLSMPELSGRKLLDQVTVDHPDLPVVVLTATADLETAVACMQAGAKDYLVKPVE